MFYIRNCFRSSAEDETGIVVEEIISECTDAMLLVREDGSEIGDVVWCASVSVEFLKKKIR